MASDTIKSGFFAYQTVSQRKGGGLLAALRHNKRELPERGHIDHERSHLNYAITPTQSATEAHKQVLKRYIDLDIKPRANASEAIEVVFSLPASWHDRDNSDYFFACYEAVTVIFGGELISFDVHLDESAPHAHALILPILDGRLNARSILGGLGNLRMFRNEFNGLLGIPYGLPIVSGLNRAQKEALARAIIKHMMHHQDPATKSPTWGLNRESIKKNPQPYADIYGVKIARTEPKQTNKTFVGIMTSRGKGKSTDNQNAYIGNLPQK